MRERKGKEAAKRNGHEGRGRKREGMQDRGI
jgi:hypothetical protein